MEQNQTQQKPAKLPKLTKKQRGFVRDYVKDENGTQAVLKNYGVKDSIVAKSVASENLTKPYIIEAIEVKRKSLRQALQEEGIDEKYLAQKVNVLLKAVDKEGTPDYNAVDKGLKHATNIYGIEDPDKPKTTNNYAFFFNKDIQDQVKQMEDRIKQALLQKHEIS